MSTCGLYYLWHKLSWSCMTLFRPHMEASWTPRRDYQWSWHSICLPIHAQAQQTPRDQDHSLYSISPTNWWSNRTYQLGDWAVSETVCQPMSGWLVWMGRPRWVHIQQSNPLLHPNDSLHAWQWTTPKAWSRTSLRDKTGDTEGIHRPYGDGHKWSMLCLTESSW